VPAAPTLPGAPFAASLFAFRTALRDGICWNEPRVPSGVQVSISSDLMSLWYTGRNSPTLRVKERATDGPTRTPTSGTASGRARVVAHAVSRAMPNPCQSTNDEGTRGPRRICLKARNPKLPALLAIESGALQFQPFLLQLANDAAARRAPIPRGCAAHDGFADVRRRPRASRRMVSGCACPHKDSPLPPGHGHPNASYLTSRALY